MNQLRNKIAGALYGVAVGDALGGPVEFFTAEQITRIYGRVTEMVGGGWLSLSPGEVTDDTQMSLAVAEGIVRDPRNPIPAIGENFIRWYLSGPKDIGNTCMMSISNSIRDIAANYSNIKSHASIPAETWWAAAQDADVSLHGQSAGNGALMRTVYPALFYADPYDFVRQTESIAKMTHYNNLSTEACILYSRMVSFCLDDADNKDVICGIPGILKHSKYRLEINDDLQPTGFVVDSLKCALHSLAKASSFEEAIVEAVNLGGDADTIGAITGGIAGAIYGFDAIPDRWIRTLSTDIRLRLEKLITAAVKNREANIYGGLR